MQGLWPGRRWSGPHGVRQALAACRRVQVDPLDVVGRNHDLILASRVGGYRPVDLAKVLYEDRTAFEHGGNLNLYLRERLTLQWSWVRNEGLPIRWEKWGRLNAATVRRVLATIDRNGPSEARDWIEGEPVQDYRSRRLEAMALHFQWRKFDIMIHHREGNRKFYDRTERLFGPLPAPLPRDQTRDQLALETLGWLGLSGHHGIQFVRTQEDGRGRARISKRQIRDRLTAEGRLVEVTVEGDREPSVIRVGDLPYLETVEQGDVPSAWRPLTPEPEAVFLGPLDIAFAHGRSERLFHFEYLFEVYKPPTQRRWGYYVLPVLLGDRLVGRIEPVRDKMTGVLRLTRAWWEEGVNPAGMVDPLARGLRRFAENVGATEVVIENVGPPALRGSLERELQRLAV
ncbi:MAG: DNA glycosylase AlkZ-like family protein [Thermoplasmata archaeon]